MSIMMAFVGSYMTVSLSEQLRLSKKECPTSPLNKQLLTVISTICLGAVAVWGMDNLGLDAMKLVHPDTKEEQHFKVQVGLMFLPLIAIVLFSYAGLRISSNDVVFAKSKEEIIRMFMKDAANFSMKQVRSISPQQILLFSITREIRHLVVGGIITGIGASFMHYLEVESLDFQGRIEWHYGLIASSVVIASVAFTIGYWTLFRLLSIYHKKESLRILASLAITGGICGMYYTSTAGASFIVTEHHKHGIGSSISKKDTILTIILLLLCFLWIIIMYLLSVSRKWIHISSFQLLTFDKIINDYAHDSATGFTKIQQFRSDQILKYSIQSTYVDSGHRSKLVSSTAFQSIPNISDHLIKHQRSIHLQYLSITKLANIMKVLVIRVMQ
eukprot:gene4785-6711_t